MSVAVGKLFRQVGKSFEKAGLALESMAEMAYVERLVPSTRIVTVNGKTPTVKADEAFVAPNATLAGNVTVGKGSSVWYGAVVSGSKSPVVVGEQSNLQDRVIVHNASIGNKVSIGASAELYDCTVEDECIVGPGVKIASGAVVQKHAILTAGAVVGEKQVVASGELWSGHPAKCLRKLSEEEIGIISSTSVVHSELSVVHAIESAKTYEHLIMEEKLLADTAWNEMIVLHPNYNTNPDRTGLIYDETYDASIDDSERIKSY